MNRSLLAAVLAATALSSTIAWAEQRDPRGEGGQQEQRHQQQRQGNQPARQPQQQQRQQQQQQQRQAQTQRQAQPQAQHQPQGQAQAQRQPLGQHQPRQQAQQGYSDPYRTQGQAQPRQQAQVQRQGGPAPRGGGFSYGGRQHAQIQAPGYSYPQGYGYRRWGVGQDLPMLFLSSQYFFNSYGDYGIGPPPYGSHWVRYGPDLLLVSDRTGRIRQVIYGAFY